MLTVADVDWARFLPAFTAARPSPLLDELPEAPRAATGEAPAAGLRRWPRELSRPSRTGRTQAAALLDLVRAEAAAVLGHRSAADGRPGPRRSASWASTR